MATPRYARLALATSTALALWLAHSFGSQVWHEYNANLMPEALDLYISLTKLETALSLISLGLLAWVFTPQKGTN